MPITLSSTRRKLISSLFSGEGDGGKKKKKGGSTTRAVAPVVVVLRGDGGGRGGASKTRSRFLMLQASIVDRLRIVRDTIDARHDVRRLLNPRDAIMADARIRDDMRSIAEEWHELSGIHDAEAGKRRSKFASEELDEMRRTVVRLNVEIENAREAQRGRYANGDGAGGGDVVRRVRSNLTNLASSSGSDHGVYRSSSKYDDGDNDNSGTPLAGRQRDALHRLQDVDAIEIDADLDEIHEGIKRLHELALRQGEEVRRHGDMLDVVDGRIDYSCVRTMKATSKVERFGRKV